MTISKTLTKNFLRECLTAKQMRVEIYEPEEGAAGRKNNARWVLGKSASPGNIGQVEDLLFSDMDLSSNAVMMAVKVVAKDGGRIVGCGVIDVQEKVIRVAEYVDDENFGNTEVSEDSGKGADQNSSQSLLIQLGVKECLVPANEKDQELAKLRLVMDRCGIIVTERRLGEHKSRAAKLISGDFATANVEQDLKRLLDESATTATPRTSVVKFSGPRSPAAEFDLKVAMSSVSALLIYLSLLSDLSNHGQFQLLKHDLSQYMRLDASAVKALTLMPNPQEMGGGKNSSVYGLLDRCKTSQGKRLLARWLKQPLVNLHEIGEYSRTGDH